MAGIGSPLKPAVPRHYAPWACTLPPTAIPLYTAAVPGTFWRGDTSKVRGTSMISNEIKAELRPKAAPAEGSPPPSRPPLTRQPSTCAGVTTAARERDFAGMHPGLLRPRCSCRKSCPPRSNIGRVFGRCGLGKSKTRTPPTCPPFLAPGAARWGTWPLMEAVPGLVLSKQPTPAGGHSIWPRQRTNGAGPEKWYAHTQKKKRAVSAGLAADRDRLKSEETTPVFTSSCLLIMCKITWRRASQSVAEQPGPRDWECILVDDGSTDTSGQICDVWRREIPSAWGCSTQQNGGLANARNRAGCRKGDWVLFLDRRRCRSPRPA